ncbi:MAG: AAA family ATPase [Myxococcales bacterium]|nr:AAA family ATPase [Myxococcales bacterium]
MSESSVRGRHAAQAARGRSEDAHLQAQRKLPLDGDAFVVGPAWSTSPRRRAPRAIPDGKRLVLVGDVDQLPSVGPGNVLLRRDRSGVVSVARLTTVFRQARTSRIVLAAHAINRGEAPRSSRPAKRATSFVPSKDAASTARIVEKLVTERIPRKLGLDPVRDVQVLTPMQGPARRPRPEHRAPAPLEPRPRWPRPPLSRTYRVGDKVMQVKNNYDAQVYNGDVGLVAPPRRRRGVVVSFGDRRIHREIGRPRRSRVGVRMHPKSPGSEYPAVVVPLLVVAPCCWRRTSSTAVTRGRLSPCSYRAPLSLALSPSHATIAARSSRTGSRAKPGADTPLETRPARPSCRAPREGGDLFFPGSLCSGWPQDFLPTSPSPMFLGDSCRSRPHA